MPRSSRHISTFRLLRITFIAVMVATTGAVGLLISRDRSDALESGLSESRRLAIVVGGQLEKSIQAVDIVLRELQQRLDALDITGPVGELRIPDPQAFRANLLQRLSLLSQAYQINVMDARGQLHLGTVGWPTPAVEAGDRAYFQELRDHDDDRLAISMPSSSRATGESIIILARRLNGPYRSFIGVVFISLKTQYFENVYAGIKSFNQQAFSLLRRNGAPMLLFPDSQDGISEIPLRSDYYTAVRDGGGVIATGSGPDARWTAIAPVGYYPLVVGVTTPEHVLLAKWRWRTITVVTGTALFLFCMFVLLSFMTRQYRELSASGIALAKKSAALEYEHHALQVKEESLDAAVNNMRHGLVMFDASARLVICNELYRDMHGLTSDEASPGRRFVDILRVRQQKTGFPTDLEQYQQTLLKSLVHGNTSSDEYRTADGRIIEVWRRSMKSGGWVTTHEDITARRRAEAKIEHLAQNDLLTGIANRSQFLNRIQKASDHLNTTGQPFSVLMLDLDHFKQVNDTLGHGAGDALLKEVANRLQSSLRASDVAARLGGDEFAIIQAPPRAFLQTDDIKSVIRESAIALSSRIIDLINEPFNLNGEQVMVGASVGIALAPEHGSEPDELVKKADLALYSVKAGGRNRYAFYTTEMSSVAEERRGLEIDLRAALTGNELELHYQTQFDLVTGLCCGVEALVRWRHPKFGLVLPGRFIDVAEDTGLITPLGDWAIQTACADAINWPPHIRVAVNVSPTQFKKTNLLDVVMCALVESGLSPDRLEIEITEQVLLEDEATHIAVLHQLKNLGVSIALDDFGSGYSSLTYLKMFPFDKIKIDRSFIDDLLEQTECSAIVCAIAGLGRALGVTTLAEGVERDAQVVALRAAGLTQAQGFLFGRPVPVTELTFDAPTELRARSA